MTTPRRFHWAWHAACSLAKRESEIDHLAGLGDDDRAAILRRRTG